MVPTAWIYSIQFKFWPPQLHQHLHPHSTYHLGSRTYRDINSREISFPGLKAQIPGFESRFGPLLQGLLNKYVEGLSLTTGGFTDLPPVAATLWLRPLRSRDRWPDHHGDWMQPSHWGGVLAVVSWWRFVDSYRASKYVWNIFSHHRPW